MTGSGEREPRPRFFVIGTGRCGSTLLSNLLRQQKEVLSLSEFFSVAGGSALLEQPPLTGGALWELLRRPSEDLRTVLGRVAIPEVLARAATLSSVAAPSLVTFPHLSNAPEALERAFTEFLAPRSLSSVQAHLTAAFEWLCERFERRMWVERSGGSIEYAEALRDAWPDAGIVHLIRDGRDCAISMSRHPLFKLRVARLVLGKHLSPAECLATDVALDRYGAYWSALLQRTNKLVESSPGARTLVLEYESLVRTPEIELPRLARFMNIEADSGKWLEDSRASMSVAGGEWKMLPQRERDALERAVRPGMRCLERLRGRAA